MSVIDIKSEKQSSESEDSNEVEQVVKSECSEQLQEPVLNNRDMIDENNDAGNSNDSKAAEMQQSINIDKGDGFPVEINATNLKRKTDDAEAEPPSKYQRMEIASQSSTSQQNEATTSYQKEVPKEVEEIVDKETARKHAKNKGKISQLVMSFLNRKYKDNKIAGADPKALYKVMARRITHMFYDRNPSIVPKTKEVERYVEALFETHEIVTSEQDLDNI